MAKKKKIAMNNRELQRARKSNLFVPAHSAVRRAVKNGLLPRLDGTIKCVDCGDPAKQYDHRDYSKHLEVNPVCRSCNLRRGPAKQYVENGLILKRGRKMRAPKVRNKGLEKAIIEAGGIGALARRVELTPGAIQSVRAGGMTDGVALLLWERCKIKLSELLGRTIKCPHCFGEL
jgi:hypothetical protein